MNSIDLHIDILKKNNITPSYIVDIGTRDGDDAEYYRDSFNLHPSKVYLFEPNPALLYSILQKYPHATLIPKAVSNVKDWYEFYQVLSLDKRYQGMSSLVYKSQYTTDPELTVNKIKVQTITGESFLQEYNLNNALLKLDVEGHTYEVLEGFGKTLKSFNSLHIETEKNQVWKGQKVKHEINDLLIDLGFIREIETVRAIPVSNYQYDEIWLNKECII